MADKTIGELTAATAVTQSDKFVMEQNGQPKSLSGAVLMKDLAKMLEGHGGIKDIKKISTVGYVDTYEIITDDGTAFRFTVTNGKDGAAGKSPAITATNVQEDGRNGVQIVIRNVDGVTPDQEVKVYDGLNGKAGAQKNWLDNSDFRKVVNQRQQILYEGEGYAIDRWESPAGGRMTIERGEVTDWMGTYTQLVTDYNFMGIPITMAAKFADGTMAVGSAALSENLTYIAAYAGPGGLGARVEASITGQGFIQISIESAGGNPPVWAALYIGAYTEETLPEYQYKGYAAELMECQRYYRRYPANNILAMGYTDAEGKVFFSIPVSTEFKYQPGASELTGAKIIVDGDVITITDRVIPRVTSRDFNAVHFSLDDDFLLSDKPNEMVAISNATVFELFAG